VLDSPLPSTRLGLIRAGTRRLDAADRDAPRRTAEWLLAEVLDCDRAALYTQADQPVASDAADRFRDMIQRREEGEPLQHVLGYASFRGLQIEVSPAVMVPRPETEEVVETALRVLDGVETPRVLDVGTGSGCIALALKHERPDAEVYACDVRREALEIARTNAQRLGLNASFIHADLFSEDFLDRMPRELNLLVANPPYIPDDEADTLPPVVRDYDPDIAVFAGDDPLRFYRRLADVARTLHGEKTAVVLEAHADYAGDVADLLRTCGLSDVQVEPDVPGRPRIVRGRGP